MRIKHLAASIALATCANYSFAAGIQTQMDSIYLQMENYTQPGAFQTQQRGGFSGGRYTLKQQIWSQNAVTFEPPSARGGCGGVDVFGGSFSFINADQAVQLLRAVAANASTYAFSLALDAACPSCIEWMDQLQSKIQKMNSDLGNSCQLAQGLVLDAKSAWTGKENTDANVGATLAGLGADAASIWNHIEDAEPAIEKLWAADPVEVTTEQLGSILYKELKKAQFNTWFTSGDNYLLEFAVSVIGTHVRPNPSDDADGLGKKIDTYWVGPLQNPEEIFATLIGNIDGTVGSIDLYDCAAATSLGQDICMIAQTGSAKHTVAINGFQQKLQTGFIGPSGIITNWVAGNYNLTLTAQQQNVLAALPSNFHSRIYALLDKSPSLAEQWVKEGLPIIATAMVDSFVRQVINAVNQAILLNDQSLRKEMEDSILRFSTAWDLERERRDRDYGATTDLDNKYYTIMRTAISPKLEPAQTQGSMK